MTIAIELWNLLIHMPIFQILLNVLEGSFEDFNVYYAYSSSPNKVESVRLGCGVWAQNSCELISSNK